MRLTKNNFALDHAFLYISLSSLQYREKKMWPKFTFSAKTSTQDNHFFYSFPELRYNLFELNPREICQHMKKWKSSVGISAVKFEAIRIQFLYSDVFVTTAVFLLKLAIANLGPLIQYISQE